MQIDSIWGEPERAPHRRYSWGISCMYYGMTVTHAPHLVVRSMQVFHDCKRISIGFRDRKRKSIYCLESLVLPDGFGVSLTFVVVGVCLAFVVHSMNSTKDQRVSSPLTSELAVDEKERRLQRRGRGHAVTLKQRNKGRNM